MHCRVKLLWDNEAAVWKVKYTVPELLELDGIKADYCDLNFIAKKTCRVITA